MKKLFLVISMQVFVLLVMAQQTPDLHAPTATNNTANYWTGTAPANYNFPTNESVVINHDTNCGSGFDTCANQFPSLVLHGSGTAFHSAFIFGTNGNMELRRTFNSGTGLNIRTRWTNDQGALNTAGGYIALSPRATTAVSGQFEPTEAMRVMPGGNVGIGTTAPTEQLHSTSGVRFAGLTSTTDPPRTIVSDTNGKLFYVEGAPVTSDCSTANTIPMMTGTNAMGCSNITQVDNLSNCGAGTHIGVGINGTPVATATSGSTCYDIMLTVNGSAYASGGLWIASDRRVKKDIAPISSGLEKVMKMNAVNYEYDNHDFPKTELPQGMTAGFIAQELKAIIPEAVGVTDNGLHVVNYDVVVPYLVASIQDQTKIIEKQNALLEELSQRISKIEESGEYGMTNHHQLDQRSATSDYFKAVPNPFADNLAIEYNLEEMELAKNAKVTFRLFNASGQDVLNNSSFNTTGRLNMDTSNLPAGIYFLNMFVNGQLVNTQQVVK